MTLRRSKLELLRLITQLIAYSNIASFVWWIRIVFSLEKVGLLNVYSVGITGLTVFLQISVIISNLSHTRSNSAYLLKSPVFPQYLLQVCTKLRVTKSYYLLLHVSFCRSDCRLNLTITFKLYNVHNTLQCMFFQSLKSRCIPIRNNAVITLSLIANEVCIL